VRLTLGGKGSGKPGAVQFNLYLGDVRNSLKKLGENLFRGTRLPTTWKGCAKENNKEGNPFNNPLMITLSKGCKKDDPKLFCKGSSLKPEWGGNGGVMGDFGWPPGSSTGKPVNTYLGAGQLGCSAIC